MSRSDSSTSSPSAGLGPFGPTVADAGAGAGAQVQATAEGAPCPAEDFQRLIALAGHGITQLLVAQRAALGAGA